MPSQQAPSTFVSFPGQDDVLRQLRAIEGSGHEHEPLFRLVGERLALKTYDRSAFVFILIELIYEFEEIAGHDWDDLLSRLVLALTEDPELAESALEAYDEIKATLEPATLEPVAGDEPARRETVGIPEIGEAFFDDTLPILSDAVEIYVPSARSPEQERLMLALQEAQKRLADLGLSARMSIDMSLSRTSREGVSHALREISLLRAALRGFEALLSESEDRILEQIGILEKD